MLESVWRGRTTLARIAVVNPAQLPTRKTVTVQRIPSEKGLVHKKRRATAIPGRAAKRANTTMR